MLSQCPEVLKCHGASPNIEQVHETSKITPKKNSCSYYRFKYENFLCSFQKIPNNEQNPFAMHWFH